MSTGNWGNNLCVICGPNVPGGLHVVFEQSADGIRAEITVEETWQGYPGVVHGGILAGLVDDAMWHAIYSHGKVSTMTADLNVRYHSPVPVGQPIVVVASITKFDRRLSRAQARIFINPHTPAAVSAIGRFISGVPERIHQ